MTSAKELSDQEKEQIVSLWRGGKNLGEITRELGHEDHSHIYRYLVFSGEVRRSMRQGLIERGLNPDDYM